MSQILAALGWLTETFVASLVQKATEVAIQWSSGVEDGDGDGQTLNKLKNSLLKIQPIVSKVENMWIEDEILKRSVNELFLQLKDAAYDAEDLLDELQCRSLQQKIEQQGDEASNLSSCSSGIPPRKKRKSTWTNAARSLFSKRDDKDVDVIKVMKETRERLDSIATDINERIAWTETNGRGKELMLSSESRKTSSLVGTRLFGRETELKELGRLLSKSEDGSDNSNISVLTIVGIGGVGKTTLVQEAYNKLVGGCFDFKFWVCVSDNFSVERLTIEMIESTTRGKCDLKNLDTLQLSIKDEIASKRFLLVLDDVWDLDSQKWERFYAPLTFGAPGSKILITTRFRNIADIVGSANPINLYGLDEKSFWEYFEKCAFISQNSGDYPELEAIAKKNIYKLKGLPLAARTLGGLLSQNMDERHWETVLDSEIWKLQQKETDVLPVLQLSYQYLPTHLKRCFVFCSLFPKDFIFQERYLIQIWMAEGFVVPQDVMRMEDIGSIYFRELVNRSFFHQSQYEGKYVIHDLLHDLAELISEGECYRIEGSKPHEIPSIIRHMSVFRTNLTKLSSYYRMEGTKPHQIPNMLEELNCCNKLRTFMFISDVLNEPISLLVHTLFERLKRINVLVFRCFWLRELPETISNLVQLRYLDISDNPFLKKLPESLCNLYNLQTVILTDLPLQRLPYGMSKLMNLRHLVAADETISTLSEVGKLTSLQELSAFQVLKKHGHTIEELNHLTQLQGILRIKNLENIASEDEARKGKLKSKKYLEGLQLEWSPPYDTNLEKQQLIILEEVLEALQPHQSLKVLTIKGYKGARSPSWLKAEVLYNLETLALLNCKRWKDLSYIVQFQQLKRLHINGIPGTKQISHQFCCHMGSKFFSMLEELHLEDISALEEIHNLGQFSCLKVLYMMKMPSLKYFSYPLCDPTKGKFFPALRELVLEDLLVLEEIPNLGRLSCLKILHIKRMPLLKYIGHPSYDSIERKSLPVLEKLVLEDLLALEELPYLRGLPCLKVIHMIKIPAVKYFDNPLCGSTEGKFFPVLEKLWLEDLLALEEIYHPGQLSCLKVLHIKRLPSLKYIGHPSYGSLERKNMSFLKELVLDELLALEEFPNLGQLPCVKVIEIKNLPSLKYLGYILSDVTERNMFPMLQKLVLEDLLALEEVPNLGQLPCLKFLCIQRIPKLKTIGREFFGAYTGKCFPCLEYLLLEGMPAWEEWSWPKDQALFACLDYFTMSNCPKLTRLPPFPCSLRNLFLREVGLTELPRLYKGIESNSSNITPCLSVLSIHWCQNLKNLEEGLLMHHLPNIKSIIISKCEELIQLPVRSFQELTSLKSLTIEGCSKLMTQDEKFDLLPPSIEDLKFHGTGDLNKFRPSCLHDLISSLTQLSIGDYPHLVSLPRVFFDLKKLKILSIVNCGELKSIKGLGDLESLKYLTIERCPKLLPDGGNKHGESFLSLISLQIDDTALLKFPSIRKTLPSVLVLTISSSSQEVVFEGEDQELLRSLTALERLLFHGCANLQFLPTKLHTLSTLWSLEIGDSPQVKSLPETGLPTSLTDLIVWGNCHPTLQKQSQEHSKKDKVKWLGSSN